VNAPPAAQLRLLDLQALDSALDRLEHRRRTLPELAQLDALDRQLARLRDALIMAETEDSDLGREQDKLEHDVDLVRARAVRDQERLDAGSVASPRELENLQSEIASLSHRHRCGAGTAQRRTQPGRR
jgi:predicted  nucleic acid-binding Zn-ribbon protein